jgi:hypothetical protein
MKNGFLLGAHHGMTIEDVDYVCDKIKEYFNKMKVVYVTGCLGFIGSYVTRKCLEKGWYVRGIDKMHLCC